VRSSECKRKWRETNCTTRARASAALVGLRSPVSIPGSPSSTASIAPVTNRSSSSVAPWPADTRSLRCASVNLGSKRSPATWSAGIRPKVPVQSPTLSHRSRALPPATWTSSSHLLAISRASPFARIVSVASISRSDFRARPQSCQLRSNSSDRPLPSGKANGSDLTLWLPLLARSSKTRPTTAFIERGCCAKTQSDNSIAASTRG